MKIFNRVFVGCFCALLAFLGSISSFCGYALLGNIAGVRENVLLGNIAGVRENVLLGNIAGVRENAFGGNTVGIRENTFGGNTAGIRGNALLGGTFGFLENALVQDGERNCEFGECLDNEMDGVGEVLILDKEEEGKKKDFIRWVDLNFTEEILGRVLELDVRFAGSDVKFDFVEALSYLATKNGNNFSAKDNLVLDKLVKKLQDGGRICDEYGDNKYYKYYLKAFSAVFAGFVGEYALPSGEGGYGLTAYFPLARGYWYNHYDDFGNSRSYGFRRKHLGHDIMGGVGTPITAIEGGTITELGWNRYGGWRVGVLSFDRTRYYYYAHLRRNRPFAEGLSLGKTVAAGEVIGYLGMTGYSTTENQNLKSGNPHLHVGLQLIFDPSQADGNGEIWVDLYAITSFLARNRAKVEKDPDSKEYRSVNLRMRTDRLQGLRSTR